MASADFSRRSWKPLVRYNEFVVRLNVSKINAMFQELKPKLNFIGQNKKPVESCKRAKSLLTAMSLQNDAEAIWSVAKVNIILSEALHLPSSSNGCWPKWIFAFRGPPAQLSSLQGIPHCHCHVPPVTRTCLWLFSSSSSFYSSTSSYYSSS